MKCASFPRWNVAPRLAEQSVACLLISFSQRGDFAAFNALVERYKRMAFEVCWRVLHHQQNAENAMQRTFLVLMRNAKAIRKPESLASWLRGVALRVAREVQKYRTRLRESEPPQEIAQITEEVEFRELQALVDEGVQRLSKKNRACFILHVLEGRSKAETAAELGLKEGTVASRAARGRRFMQEWLTQHGITGP